MGLTRCAISCRSTSSYGHVNHSVYIQYFETARVELLEEIGFGLETLHSDDIALVVVRIATRFFAPAVLLDDLTIETGLVESGRVRTRWAQRIVRGDDTIATQLIDFATTMANGRPRRVPEGLGEAMERFAVAKDWLGKESPE